MALLYPQWIWGFEVIDSGAGQNNYIDLHRAATGWTATHSYSVGTVIVPAGANSNGNQFWKCTVAGTSGGSQPGWPASPTPGITTQSDGTVTWTFVVPSLAAGVYTADELAKGVADALNAVDAANAYTCSFSYSTLLFTIGGGSNFDIKWSTGPNHTKNPSGLLGIDNTQNSPSSTTLISGSVVGGVYSVASVWTAAEPLAWTSPYTVQSDWQATHAYAANSLLVPSGPNSNSTQVWKCTTAGTSGGAQPSWPASPTTNITTQVDGSVTWTFQNLGAPAVLGRRTIHAVQHVSDGATVESIYLATLKNVQVVFAGIAQSEQYTMESFLTWIVQGKRFTWQPDKTSTNYFKLVLGNPGQIPSFYQWLTRPEVGYGTLTFLEQPS